MSQKMLGSCGYYSRSSTQDVQLTAETTETTDTVDQSQSDPEPADDLDDSDLYEGTVSSKSELSSTSNCSCPCCTKPESSHHQIKPVVHHSKEQKTGQRKTCSRSIQPSWYDKHPWISVSTTRYKIFCSICRGAKQLGLVKFSKYQKSVFTEGGYGNWIKAPQRFHDHEKSDMHREATEKNGSSIYWNKCNCSLKCST